MQPKNKENRNNPGENKYAFCTFDQGRYQKQKNKIGMEIVGTEYTIGGMENTKRGM